VFGIGYQAGKNCKLGLTYFINNIGLDDGTDYKRLQLDTEYKFKREPLELCWRDIGALTLDTLTG
jgi:hypothetical protein